MVVPDLPTCKTASSLEVGWIAILMHIHNLVDVGAIEAVVQTASIFSKVCPAVELPLNTVTNPVKRPDPRPREYAGQGARFRLAV